MSCICFEYHLRQIREIFNICPGQLLSAREICMPTNRYADFLITVSRVFAQLGWKLSTFDFHLAPDMTDF